MEEDEYYNSDQEWPTVPLQRKATPPPQLIERSTIYNTNVPVELWLYANGKLEYRVLPPPPVVPPGLPKSTRQRPPAPPPPPRVSLSRKKYLKNYG